MDLSSSHQSHQSSYTLSSRKQRSGFFSSEGCSQESLPMTNTQPQCTTTSSGSPSSTNNDLRLAPSRSISSSAALLRQRGSSPTLNTSRNHSSTPIKKAYSQDLAGFVPLGYSSPQKQLVCKSTSTGTGWSPLTQALFVMALIGLCVFCRCLQEDNHELRHKLRVRDHEIEHHIEHATALEKKVQKLRTQTIRLTKQVEALEEKPAVGMTELQRKLFHMEHSSNLIQQGIQLGDRRMVREKFGPGPHFYVELTLDLPQPDNTILLQTAALDEMPHSIHLFLEQVSHGLYDGTSFHRNAQHILQAGPSRNAQSHAAFRRHPSLTSVLFQEYSHDFPHYEYTVGYAGRPGGPDFYINLGDNSELHGPGGQASHYNGSEEQMVHLQADPCFALIVKGRALIERLQALEVDWKDVPVAPVTIKTMRIVPKQEYQQQQQTSSSSSDHEDHQAPKVQVR